MLLIKNRNDVKSNLSALKQFSSLYILTFPDANEREDFDVILERVKGKRETYDPSTFIVLEICDNRVIAGLVSDWYKDKYCFHLTYLTVHPEFRQRGITKKLITIELPKIIENIRKLDNLEIKAIFFESNIPSKTKVDSFDSKTRLTIFKKMGAKWIDIPYVQPALDKNKECVDNLYLLTFPLNDESKNSMNVNLIINFLEGLFKSLKILNPYNSSDFKRMIDDLLKKKDNNNNVALKELPEN